MYGAFEPTEVCKSALWDKIDDWEVVSTVLLIMLAWTIVQVARMYYMAVAARVGRPRCCKCCEHDGED